MHLEEKWVKILIKLLSNQECLIKPKDLQFILYEHKLIEKNITYIQKEKDGEWIVFEGTAKSSVNKRQNVDIFAMKMDGTNLIQLTYHPEVDCSPVWSPDGKAIYFISSRGSRDRAYNIWKMNFLY